MVVELVVRHLVQLLLEGVVGVSIMELLVYQAVEEVGVADVWNKVVLEVCLLHLVQK